MPHGRYDEDPRDSYEERNAARGFSGHGNIPPLRHLAEDVLMGTEEDNRRTQQRRQAERNRNNLRSTKETPVSRPRSTNYGLPSSMTLGRKGFKNNTKKTLKKVHQRYETTQGRMAMY